MNQLYKTTGHHFVPQNDISQQGYLITIKLLHGNGIQLASSSLQYAMIEKHDKIIHSTSCCRLNILFFYLNFHI